MKQEGVLANGEGFLDLQSSKKGEILGVGRGSSPGLSFASVRSENSPLPL